MFASTLFNYNIDEKEKVILPLGCGWRGVPPHPQAVHSDELACLHRPRLSERGGEWPCRGRAPCPGLGLPWCSELQEQAPATHRPELQQVG